MEAGINNYRKGYQIISEINSVRKNVGYTRRDTNEEK